MTEKIEKKALFSIKNLICERNLHISQKKQAQIFGSLKDFTYLCTRKTKKLQPTWCP
jgi:hypothetical protein